MFEIVLAPRISENEQIKGRSLVPLRNEFLGYLRKFDFIDQVEPGQGCQPVDVEHVLRLCRRRRSTGNYRVDGPHKHEATVGTRTTHSYPTMKRALRTTTYSLERPDCQSCAVW